MNRTGLRSHTIYGATTYFHLIHPYPTGPNDYVYDPRTMPFRYRTHLFLSYIHLFHSCCQLIPCMPKKCTTLPTSSLRLCYVFFSTPFCLGPLRSSDLLPYLIPALRLRPYFWEEVQNCIDSKVNLCVLVVVLG